jgi:hypothetical protein
MLSETKESFSFENTTTEKDFFDGFKKQIQRQVRKFESQVPWVM